MDAYEATKIVFQRIQALDPQNASKIMGFLLIQDHGEKDMIRLAHGPESLVHSVILRAKKELNLAQPNMPLTSSTPPTSPFSGNGHSNPLSLSRQSSCFVGQSPLASASWTSSSCLSSDPSTNSPSTATMNSSAEPFYAAGGEEVDLIDELHLQDQLSFLNDQYGSSSPQIGCKSSDLFYQDLSASSTPSMNDSLLYPSYTSAWGDSTSVNHRRSCSVSDIFPDDLNGGLCWKPCLFYARGYCKNGTTCRFSHGEIEGGSLIGSSPSKLEMIEQCQEMLRSKSTQRSMVQDSVQLMSSSPNNFAYSPKSMNFLQIPSDSPRGFRTRFERDFGMTTGINSPGSRQIYLTFPADSTFKEEDVSNYFSKFGPVQDVRIPYQQKRMFGFVTFDYSETVKLILAKGNPHFVCDARVLVKPYKEKGKIPDKHRKLQHERGEFTGCGSPTGFESRDPYDLHLSARMFYNTQDIWRSKLEQADLQQAIELQNRRLMNLQLLDVKRNSNHHRTLSTGSVIASPVFSPSYLGQNPFHLSSLKNPEAQEENNQSGNPENISVSTVEKDQDFPAKHENSSGKESELQDSLDHNLPDSPFASPKASEAEKGNLVTTSSPTNSNVINGSTLFPTASSIDMAPYKSCHFQVPRGGSKHVIKHPSRASQP